MTLKRRMEHEYIVTFRKENLNHWYGCLKVQNRGRWVVFLSKSGLFCLIPIEQQKSSVNVDLFIPSFIELMTHPAHSPGLTLCDFFDFPKFKDLMRGLTFTGLKKAMIAFNWHVKNVPSDQWSLCFQKCFERKSLTNVTVNTLTSKKYTVIQMNCLIYG